MSTFVSVAGVGNYVIKTSFVTLSLAVFDKKISVSFLSTISCLKFTCATCVFNEACMNMDQILQITLKAASK